MLQTAAGGRVASLRDFVCNCNREFLFISRHWYYESWDTQSDVVSGLEYMCICRCIDTYLSTYNRYMTHTSCRLYPKRPGFSLMVHSRFIRPVTVCTINLTGWLIRLKPSFVFQFQQHYTRTKSFVTRRSNKAAVKPVMENVPFEANVFH
jgi:hypothetical protein